MAASNDTRGHRSARRCAAGVTAGLLALAACSCGGGPREVTGATPSSPVSPETSAGQSAGATTPAATTAPSPVGSQLAKPPASGSPTSPTATPTPSAGGRCRTSQLTLDLVAGSPGAGQRYTTVVLTNASGTPCTITGFGGIGLVGSGADVVPSAQVRVRTPAPTTVVLAPGASAGSLLRWSAVAGTGDATTGDCQPTAAVLEVIPPDETEPLSVPWDGGPVCEGGTVRQGAYTAR